MRQLEHEYNSVRLQMLSTGSVQQINMASAPYLESQKVNKPALRLETLYSQSERSSYANKEEIPGSSVSQGFRSGMTTSFPLLSSPERELASMAPLVESVREDNN